MTGVVELTPAAQGALRLRSGEGEPLRALYVEHTDQGIVVDVQEWLYGCAIAVPHWDEPHRAFVPWHSVVVVRLAD